MAQKKPTSADIALACLAGTHLVRWRETTHLFEGTHYRAVEDGELAKSVAQFIVNHLSPSVATGRMIAEVVTTLNYHAEFVRGDQAVPLWLDGRPRGNWLVMANGMLDINAVMASNSSTPPLTTALIASTSALLPHTPDYFCTTALPYEYDPTATCPQWLAFINWMACGEIGVADLLAEYLAYCLLPDLQLQKFMWLLGDGANGKSVFCKIAVRLFGAGNVSTVPLEDFGQRFQLTEAFDKIINIVSDVGDVDKVAEGKLKQVSAGDPIQGDRKFKKPITDALKTRLLFSSNAMPRWRDKSKGLWRRFILVPCLATVVVEDETLVDTLATELPGILNWVLAGAARLVARRKFAIPPVCESALQRERMNSNPAAIYFCEELIADKSGWIEKKELLERYAAWCGDGHFGALNRTNFYAELRKAFPDAYEHRPGPKGGYRPRGWQGLKWRTDFDHEDEAWPWDEDETATTSTVGDAADVPNSDAAFNDVTAFLNT